MQQNCVPRLEKSRPDGPSIIDNIQSAVSILCKQQLSRPTQSQASRVRDWKDASRAKTMRHVSDLWKKKFPRSLETSRYQADDPLGFCHFSVYHFLGIGGGGVEDCGKTVEDGCLSSCIAFVFYPCLSTLVIFFFRGSLAMSERTTILRYGKKGGVK